MSEHLTPDEIEIRIRCLELAVAAGDPALREQFLDFVTGCPTEGDEEPYADPKPGGYIIFPAYSPAGERIMCG